MLWTVVFFPVLLCGCPYESDIPLGACGESILDKALMGKWEFQDSAGERPATVQFLGFNEREILVLVQEEGRERVDLYRACLSRVGGQAFLSVQDLTQGSPGKWNFVHYSVAENRLVVRIVDDGLFQKPLGTSEELHQFIRENLANPALYGGEKGQLLKRARQ
jgi:hypothetical protein